MNIRNVEEYGNVGGLGALLAEGETDPRRLHDAVRHVANWVEKSRGSVPVDLRRALDELEADIAEAYYNNVPV